MAGRSRCRYCCCCHSWPVLSRGAFATTSLASRRCLHRSSTSSTVSCICCRSRFHPCVFAKIFCTGYRSRCRLDNFSMTSYTGRLNRSRFRSRSRSRSISSRFSWYFLSRTCEKEKELVRHGSATDPCCGLETCPAIEDHGQRETLLCNDITTGVAHNS